jgi:cytoskeletal protein CcmA (bactofilin family)
MLGNNKNKEKIVSNNQGLLNLIGPGTVIKGNLICDGDIRIDGKVEGTVTVGQRLVVGETGMIIGHVNASYVTISGSVIGNIQSDQTTILHGKSSVKGDVYTSQIIIESGARFNGKCVMDNQVSSETIEA